MFSFDDRDPLSTVKNLKAAAGIGYSGVELYGPNLKMDPIELKAALDGCGLGVVSLHADTGRILSLIPFAKALGLSYIGIGAEDLPDFESAAAFAKRLGEIGRECRENGLLLTYHNHTQEFRQANGKSFEQYLLDETDPACVAMELDSGWCAAAGVDPIDFVKRNPGRVPLVHIKECSEIIGVRPTHEIPPLVPKVNCLAGKGLIDWTAFLPAARENGCRCFIVERETTYPGAADRLQCLREDWEYYSALPLE